ncbi:hypothetical protein CGC21_15415 [Leishmania donovani]|uniref:Cilia- and flagella-associated protein 206 n=1 Tax=Leishmania donovani TaxID=5661 RepID=A0A504XJQ7_LEIDO|nr:hypothetical protein CGC21_15415 [Leishmania donovani]
MRKTLPTTVAAEAAPLVSAEDAWERLWRSLPSVQKQHCINTEASKEAEGAAPLQQTAKTEGSLGADVHRGAGPVSLLSVVLPRAEMAHLVTCVYLALHSNAIESDTEASVEGALRAPSLGKAHGDEAEAPDAPRVLRETYTREDFIAFLESVPSRWMPDMIAAQEGEEERSLWVEFNAELVDCVVSDEAPYSLLPPTEVFTIRRTAAAVNLEAPVIDYVEVLPLRWYPAVYDNLFGKLQLNDDRSDASLTLAQFRIFFDWFHRLHFCNTDASRSNAAAEDVYNRYCDPRGQFTATQFELACEEMCAVYAQRRDAAAYLEQLVHRTEHVMAQHDEDGPVNTAQQAARMSAEFFLHPEEVTLPSWRRYLTSPVSLYMPDELRVVQQEIDRYHRHRCPRILLLGPAGIGKSEVGRQLAEELHCVHLDVLELAMAALRDTAQRAVAEELEYRGYIFSDTMFSTAETTDAFLEHFVRPLQLSEMARPDHVVEVCTAVPDVYQEHASGRIAIAAAASQQAWDAFVKDEAQKARALEKAQMRADCEKILAHLVEMEGATGKAAPPAADLELARRAAEVRLRLASLIHDGRIEAGAQLSFTTAEGAAARLPSLEEQDWTSSWRKHVEFAKSIHHHLLVDPIASASIGHVTSYIAHVFHLYPCEEPALLGYEERSRAVEEAAEEAGLSLSPVWKRYCPVTAFEDHVLIEGAACYACTYRGHYYCFASTSKRAAFVDFPIKYLRQRRSPDRKPVLVVADDTLVHSKDAMVETMQRVVGEVAAQLNLTPYTVSEFVKLLEPRQALLQARHAACVGRQMAEEEARKARAERLELAAKAQAKKKKGKMEPKKPKLKKKASGPGRASFLQQALQDRQGSAAASVGARRRVPRTMFLEGPQSMADEKAMHIRAAKEKAACTAPLLLSAVTSVDLQKDILHGLWEGDLLPETVLVLRPADAPVAEMAEEDEETEKGSANGSDLPVLSQTLRLLKRARKVERRSVMASRSHPSARQSQPFNVLTISLPKTPVVHEVIAEVMQLLDPLAIQASEAAFGSRLDNCPVTLRERGILVRGRQEFCLRFVDGLYVFATQEARDAFARCPQRYVGELPPETLPPRVWLVGPTRSGKKTLAAGLQEAYRVPFFVYDRHFFEECVEAVLTPGGGMVRGVYIPQDSEDTNPYVDRARMLLEEVRNRAREEKTKLKARAEAERLLQEREQREEEPKEADLQEKLEFEPEDPEDKQARLSEAYLRIASCVTRFRPFDTLGYVMICPPFSDGDLDVLFDEGCIPEVVMRLNIDEETFAQRGALRATERREAVEHASVQDTAAKEVEATKQATQAIRDAARLQRRREKALRKWRRRHIGANDVDSPSEEEAEAPPAQGHSGDAQSGDDHDDLDSAAAAAIHGEGQLGMEEDHPTQEEALDEFMGIIEERHVEVVRVDGRAARETVCRAVVEALGRHMRHRASLFYVPEVMRFEDAMARLTAGGCDLSSFGYEDPVRLYRYRQEGPQTACAWKPAGVRVGPEQPLQESAQGFYADDAAGDAEAGDDNELEEPEVLSEVLSDEVQELRDVVERRKRRCQRKAAPRVARVNHRLYFFKDDDSLLCFVRDPWPFMRQAPPNPTLLQQPVVSVYEHDVRYATEKGSAKERVLADSVAFNLGMRCMSVSSLLAWGAVHPHWHALKLDCMLAAQQGSADPTLVQKLLVLYLSTAEVKHSGAVLHNLPHTAMSAEALPRVACAAPIVKVMAASSAPLRDGRADDHSAPDADGEADGWSAAVAALERHAAVRLPLPRPSVPLDASNLVAAVHGVEEYVQQTQESVLREQRAFPARLHNSYQVYSYVHRHLSQFTAFCPYEWLEHDDLVRSVHAPQAIAAAAAMSTLFWLPATNEVDLRWGAIYLNQYFFFSSAEYLERFLVDPTTVTDASKAKPMPKHFPVIILHPVDEACLALEGCCPVLLYDTREIRGMRRVIQPVAKKGLLDCVVEYDGKLYALRNKEHMARFLRRPWQYVDGAHLPQMLRRPLPTGTSPSDIVDHEEYIQRQLYDPVALALLAVAQARPIYPGLSVEESALKYIALYLKAHRDPDSLSDFEEKTYRRHFEVYQQRATLYRHLPSSSPKAKTKQTSAESATGAVTVSAAAAEREYCAAFDNSMAAAGDMSFFNRLPRPSDAAL